MTTLLLTDARHARAAVRPWGWLAGVRILVLLACIIASLPALHGALGLTVPDALDQGVLDTGRSAALRVELLAGALVVAAWKSARQRAVACPAACPTGPGRSRGSHLAPAPPTIRSVRRLVRSSDERDASADLMTLCATILTAPRLCLTDASGGLFCLRNGPPPSLRGGVLPAGG